jgi:hypothetical protein
MTIKIQATPNPNALKFILPEKRFPKPLNISSHEAAADHPLAAQLMALDGVYNVFMVQDFVTVNKRPDVSWEPLRGQAEAVILAYLG